MQSNLYMLQRESDFIVSAENSFHQYVDKLKDTIKDTSSKEEESLEEDIHNIDSEILEVKEKIKQVNIKRQEQKSKHLIIQDQIVKTSETRDALSHQINILSRENNLLIDRLSTVNEEIDQNYSNIDRFKQINAMNDAFFVWYSGPYATINTFRLGSLPNKVIEFTEINAALGQAALVLDIITQKVGIELKHFNIIPFGSFAKIVKVEDKKTSYPLFYDPNTFSFFPKRNFNLALSGFMQCIVEIGDFISSYDPTLSVPCKINLIESKIGDLVYTFGVDEEIWTRALKFMLANIKWIIAWFSKHGHSCIPGL